MTDTPSAVKRGRNSAFPYIAVIIRADGTTHNANVKRAFATREEAIHYAERWIAAALALQERQAAAYAKRHGEG